MLDHLVPVLFWVLLLFTPLAAIRFIFTALDAPERAVPGDGHATDFARFREVYLFVVWIGLGGIFFLGLDAIFYRAARWMGLSIPTGWREASMLLAFTLSFFGVFTLILQLDEVHAYLAKRNSAEAETAALRVRLQKLVADLDDGEPAGTEEMLARFIHAGIHVEHAGGDLSDEDRDLVRALFAIMRRQQPALARVQVAAS